MHNLIILHLETILFVTNLGGWLITGGKHSGFMKSVGKAVNESVDSEDAQEIICIGIASWSTISNKDCLIRKKSQFLQVAKFYQFFLVYFLLKFSQRFITLVIQIWVDSTETKREFRKLLNRTEVLSL